MRLLLIILLTSISYNCYTLTDSDSVTIYLNKALIATNNSNDQLTYSNLLKAREYCKDTADYVKTYCLLGAVIYKLTDFYFAFDYLDSALKYDNNNKYKSYLYNIYGVIYSDIGRYDSAYLYFSKALNYENAETGVIYNNIARVFSWTQRLDSSKYYLTQAYSYNKNTKGIYNYSTIISGLDLYRISGDQRILKQLKTALDSLKNPYLLGLYYSYTDQFEKGEHYLKNEPYPLLELYVNSKQFLKALPLIDTLRSSYLSMESKLFLQKDERKIYYNAIEQALETDTTLAFEIALKSRANLLRDELPVFEENEIPRAWNYFDFDSVIYLFRSGDEIKVHRIVTDTVFNANYRRFLECMQIDSIDTAEDAYYQGYKDYCYIANYLYQQLVPEPAAEMCIIPDGRLHYIPFEALLTEMPDTSRPNFKVLPYLMNSSVIHYDYLLRNHRPAKKYSRLTLLAPDLNLLFSQQLAKKLRLRANVFTGSRAEISKIHKGNILHIEAHYRPQDKFIALADTLLYVENIDSLHLQMVVIATCYSGIGIDHKGEGVFSPGRSFYKAGAQSVVESIWESDGQSSYEMLYHFYRQLKKGKSKNIALTRAKAEYLNNCLHSRSHPFYWAHLRLFGNASNTKPVGGWIWLMFFPGVIAVIVGLKYLFRLHRKSS